MISCRGISSHKALDPSILSRRLPVVSSHHPPWLFHHASATSFNIHLTLHTSFNPRRLYRKSKLELWGLLVGSSVRSEQCGSTQSQGLRCKALGSKAIASEEVGSVKNEDGWKGERKKLALFLSGGGSNFRALHNATLENRIYGDIVAVVSDKPGCKGCDYANEHGILVIPYPKGKFVSDGMKLVQTLRDHGVDFVLLAGYLKLLPVELVQAYPRSILNIHPALLPAFGGKGYYGLKVHEAVIKSGARFSGPTIHFVDEKYDHGPILAQRVVQVLPSDSPNDLATKVLKEEHGLYVEAAAALCEDRIFWREDGVPLIRKSWDEAEYY
ncbi:hypothetical protein O6H91_01G061100 [Diphasiastrum complanatum]|uniref:Uncharacterized protein n=1 Tax=Diphasiastrum complanatum TaxID=34168 RepID=A0ACC2ERF5_DIPCM|nr:hypothetical protein O6H91_01G061100 [Diphasiastrum complanatum]